MKAASRVPIPASVTGSQEHERDREREGADEERHGASGGEPHGGSEQRVEGHEELLDLLPVVPEQRQLHELRAVRHEQSDDRQLDDERRRDHRAPQPQRLERGAGDAERQEPRHVDRFLGQNAPGARRERDSAPHHEGTEKVVGARRRHQRERPGREDRHERAPEPQPIVHRLEDDLPPESTQEEGRGAQHERDPEKGHLCAPQRVREPRSEPVDEHRHDDRGREDREHVPRRQA
jgi:hypothetical protein